MGRQAGFAMTCESGDLPWILKERVTSMKTKLSLFVLLFAWASFTLTMTRAMAGEALPVSGSVNDPQGRAVPGAAVTLFSRTSNAAAKTTTDAAGTYRFDAVAAGDYLLRAEAPGFAPYLRENLHVTAAVTADVALELAGVREQVVVTASGTSQGPEEVSKAITVIDAAEAQQRDVFALSAAVDLAPGVRVQQLGGPGQLATIHIRGMRNQDTAVLVDGMRLRDAGAIQGDASGLIEDLLLTNTDRMEVMNGAGSSLYGSNAIGGVVNILTDGGGGRTRGSVLAEGGSLGAMRGRAQVAGALAGDRLQYSVGLAYVDVTGGIGGYAPYRNSSGQGTLAYRLSNSTILTARLFAADSFGKLNASPVQTGMLPLTGIVNAVPGVTFLPDASDPDSTRAFRFLNGVLGLDGQPSAKLHYAIRYQVLASGRRYGNGPGGPGYQPLGNQRTLYDGRIQTVNGQLHYQFRPAHLLTAGYEFENENYTNDFVDRSDPQSPSSVNARQKSNALFVQDQAKFLEGRLLFSGAFRAQYFSLDRPVFSPVASAPYAGIAFPSPPAAYTGDGSAAYYIRQTGTKLRSHVGRGYRAPSLYERFGTGFDSYYGYSTYGDPRLNSEHSITFDAGIDQTFAHGRVRTSATYFYTRLQQVIAFGALSGADPFGRYYGYLNGQGGLSRGVEMNAKVSPVHGIDLSAAYTFVNAAELTPVVGNVLRTFVIPRNQFSAAATWRAGTRTVLTLDTLQSGNYLAPVSPDYVNSFTTRVYSFNGMRRVSAGVSYRLPLGEFRAARFFVRAENLTGQVYFENGFRTPGRTANGGIQFEF
jgi:vitamin B12 transporter